MTHTICKECETVAHCSSHGCIPVQAQRTWVGLTDDERLFLHGHDSELDDLISVIEAKLKEKNDRP